MKPTPVICFRVPTTEAPLADSDARDAFALGQHAPDV
jgi:hypothetical protein